MITGRAIRAAGCAICRSTVSRTGTTIPCSSIRPSPISRISRARQFSSQLAQEGIKDDQVAWEPQAAEENYAEIETEAPEASSQVVEVSTLPWYLKVKSPQRAPEPLSERQRIPDLPASPPPILQPLLKELSTDLGLDSLSIMDLRKLDPPPALGANLIMLLGTARSEKHLHVSADRLCRWLRSTYKLRPDADGLLGRNEIKLKLRRKSRRSKLLGGALDETEDDGIRTGWVCVDVGAVDGPAVEAEAAPAPKNFVGFGRRTDGVRIVVQMLTEEKREEINLERLWGGILKRSIQAKEPDSGLGQSEEHLGLEYPIPTSATATGFENTTLSGSN